MGIVKLVLGEFKLENGTEYTIEYNESGIIHIHMDEITLAFEKQSFKHLVDLVKEANAQLSDRKPEIEEING